MTNTQPYYRPDSLRLQIQLLQIEATVAGWERAADAMEADFGWSPSIAAYRETAHQIRSILQEVP